jgi:AcrR family transcriptional regulator
LAKLKRTKRAYDAQATRRRIVSVAAEEFQKRGYHATSMHDIMDLANVPGGSVYYHFPTKKSLGLAVIREAVAQSIDETWIIPMRTAKSAKDGVLKVFAAVADQIERDGRGVSGCPLNNLTIELSLADAEFQSALREVFDSWASAVAKRIREDIRDRKIQGIDPNETALAIVASFSGAMALAKAAQSAGPIKTCARQIGHLFARA